MRYGEKGIVILIVAICVCGFGGFVFNVTDEAVAKSDFTYITDVAGSFTGSNGDISVDYNPYTNLTGYSVFDPTTNIDTANVIKGINFKKTGANGYVISENIGDVTEKTLTFTNNKSTTSSGTGTGTMVWGSTTRTFTIEKEYGRDNTESKTQINVGGQILTRVVAIPLSEILSLYGSFSTNKVIMSVQGGGNNYPGFIANESREISYQTPGVAAINYVQVLITYTDLSSTITINPAQNIVIMNGKTYPTDAIKFVWGTATSTTATVKMIVGAEQTISYLDPAYGITPVSITDTSTQVVTITGYPDNVKWSISVPKPISGVTGATGRIYLEQSGGTQYVDYSIIYSASMQEIRIDDEVIWYGATSNSTVGMDVTWAGDFPIYFNIKGTGGASSLNTSINVGHAFGREAEYAEITVNSSGSVSANTTTYSISSEYEGDMTTVSNTGPGTLSKYLESTHTETITTTTTYNTTYWSNTQLNNSSVQYNGNTMLAMMFKRPTTNLYNSFEVYLRHADNSVSPITVNINYTNSGWVINGTEYGIWQGILLTFRVIDGGLTLEIQPVSSFTTFINYVLVDRIYTQDTYSSLTGIKTIQYMKFSNTDSTNYMWHEVIATSVYLAGGGLYIQDGIFNLKSSFPNDMLVAFKIMSAAHVGTGISIYPTNGVPTTWSVNSAGTGWVIDGKTYRFSDVTFYYADANLPPITIGGTVYDGLYMDGEEYDKGHLYYKAGTFGALTDLGETTNDWRIKLNGTWAMSTAYYEGETIGDVQTKFSNIGSWGWDTNQVILVFIGVLIIGMSIVAWRFDADITDWIVVICAGAISFILLG